MRFLAATVVCLAYLWGGDAAVLQADRQGVELGAWGLRLAAPQKPTAVRVVHQGAERVLLTPVAATVEVSQGKILLARLNPGKTYYFEPEGAGQNPGQSPQDSSAPQQRKLSPKLKWGLAAAIATGAGIGIKLALDEPESVSRR